MISINGVSALLFKTEDVKSFQSSKHAQGRALMEDLPSSASLRVVCDKQVLWWQENTFADLFALISQVHCVK